MKKAFGDYRLLAKGNRRTGHLWQGPDHLLYVETAVFLSSISESYKRIDYRNIQAITYAQTRMGIWTTLFYLLLLLIFGWAAISALIDSSPALIFSGPIAVIALGGLIIHLKRGPTCVCKLQTAVQFLNLKPLNRIKNAARFAQAIAPLCHAHQGDRTTSPVTLSTNAVPVDLTDHTIKQAWDGSKLVTWALALLVISGALTAADVFIQNMLFFTIDCFVGVTAYVLLIAALVRSLRFEIPASLKGSLWGGVVNLVFLVITGYGLTIWAGITESRNLMNGNHQVFRADANYAIYKVISDAGIDELGWVAWVLIGIGCLAIFFGLLGLPAALRPGAKMPDAQKPSIPPPIRNNPP